MLLFAITSLKWVSKNFFVCSLSQIDSREQANCCLQTNLLISFFKLIKKTTPTTNYFLGLIGIEI